MSAPPALGLRQRHEELYGESRKEAARQLRAVLTADHIGDHVKHLKGRDTLDHDADLRWKSITKWTFRGAQPAKGGNRGGHAQQAQNTTHFDFGFDTANIDDGIYKSSMTRADYDEKDNPRIPPRKPDDTINLPDFAPRYMDDKAFGTSFYSSVFDDKNRVDPNQGNLLNARTALRQTNVEDLRTTHFIFGSDPENFLSETNLSYHHGKRSSGLTSRSLPNSSDVLKRMQLEERDSAVFRNGDYNMRKSLPMVTTNHRDFDNRLYVPRFAAIEDESIRPKLPTLNSLKQVRFSDKPRPVLHQNFPSDGVLMDLKKEFTLADVNSTGRIGKEELRSLCSKLPLPLPEHKIDDILNEIGQDENGGVSYHDFIHKYAMIPLPEKRPTYEQGESDDSVRLPKLKDSESLLAGQPVEWRSLRHENDKVGKKFHTSAHFKFGTDTEGPASIYNKDFLGEVPLEKPFQHPAPISSKVMHEVPGVGVGNTVNRTEFVNYQLTIPERMKELRRAHESQVKRTFDKLSSDHVVLTCDPDRHTSDRQQSMSHGDYNGPPTDFRPMPASTALPAKYRYLDSEGALAFPPTAPKISEAKEAYTNHLHDTVGVAMTRVGNKDTCQARLSDQKHTHFLLGSDKEREISEAHDQFDGRPVETGGKPAAGIKNASDTDYQHIRVSENTQDKELISQPTTFDAQAQLRTVVANKHKNPRDPLNVNMKRAFLEHDKRLSGKLSRDDVKRVCSNFSLDLHDGLLDKMMDKFDKEGDGQINYQEFVEHLTMPRMPGAGFSPVHTASIMKHDYRPLQSRSFTDAQLLTIDHMNKKTPRPMASHLFHMDNTGDKKLSTTSTDFIKPELMTGRKSLPAL
ncbi:uncharacterized protein [Ptychodera flava]|uniref:uncharacterized protein isoform X2 n=1 Tax=Ptychodera flava TaxID=63121 RepID=UPI003969BDEA